MSLSYLQLLQRLYGLPASQRSVEDFLRLFFQESQIGSDQWDAAFKDLTTTSHTVDSITMNTAAAVPAAPAQGQFWWDEDEETISFKQDGAILQLGQEVQYHVRNDSGVDIEDGDAVMFTGTVGNSGRLKVGMMDGTDPANARYFMGLATESIPDGADGKITWFGKVRGIDTTGGESFGGLETWADEDILYPDPVNAGYLTNVLPSSPQMALPVAVVVHAHTNGTLVVRATIHDEQHAWGDRVNGNYSEFESDGTLVFKGDATVWRDIDFPVVIRNAAANRPIITTLQGNLTAPRWVVNDYFVHEGQEFVHEWKEGSEVFWHIHVYQEVDATDSYLKFEVEYTWSNVSPTGVTIPANTTIQSGDLLVPGGTGLKFFIFSIGSFTPTGGKIAAHVKPRLKRIAASGTAPTTNPFCEMLQLHVECDTSGSREMVTK
jgi:hypothetical protein